MSEKPRIRVEADGQYNMDAWQNAQSGMGIPGVDKSVYTRFSFLASRIDWQTLSMIYRYDWLARKICVRPAADATRRWIKSDDKASLNELERLKAKKNIRKAISWARLYGGAAILLIVEDGKTPADPLDPSKVKRIIELKVVDRHNLQAKGKIEDAYAVEFGDPEFYTTNNGTVFHHSRVLKFNGAELTHDQAEQEQYWGGSYIELYQDAIKSFQGTMQDVRHIVTESGIGVLKIPGLTNSVAMGGKIFDNIQKRLNTFNLSKSNYRTAAMDGEEEFDFKNRSLAGLADIADRFMTMVAGATDMGELILFGTTPGGLNASQEEQLAVYYDMIQGEVQEGDMMPALNTILACINKGTIPEWEYKPLLEMTDKAQAEVRNTEAQAIAAVADIAMLGPEEIREHLNETGHFHFTQPLSLGALENDD